MKVGPLVTAAALLAGCAEDTATCTTKVQKKAYDLVVSAKACTTGDECEVVRWDTLLKRRGCAPAFACYTTIPTRTDKTRLASAAGKLAAHYEACGACGTAACASPAGKRPTCDVDVGQCVLIDDPDGGIDVRGF